MIVRKKTHKNGKALLFSQNEDDNVIDNREMGDKDTSPRKGIRVKMTLLEEKVEVWERALAIRMKSKGDKELPYLTSLDTRMKTIGFPLIRAENLLYSREF